MEEVKTYIVGIGGSDMDTIDTYRVVGTEEQIRKHLAKVCVEIGSEENDAAGTFKPEDIIYNGELYSIKIAEGCFAGYVNFNDSHVDITARPEGTLIYLGDDGDDEIPIEEVVRNFNERAIYVIFGDGSDALLQDNGYTIEDAKKFAKEGCTFYYDGPAPDTNAVSTLV